jgi:hypothetical protein
VRGRAPAHAVETLFRAVDGRAKAIDLTGDRVIGEDTRRDIGHFPAQEVHGADDDAGRRGDSGEGSIH